jgi:hypothetical protein
MRNKYGHHHMASEREKREFREKYGSHANFSQPGSKQRADTLIELAELRRQVQKLQEKLEVKP